MKSFSRFRRNNPAELLCQHWELRDVEDGSTDHLSFKGGNGERLFQELIIFPDSTIVRNPRGIMQIGRWHLLKSKPFAQLLVTFSNQYNLVYEIRSVNSSTMRVKWKEENMDYEMTMHSDSKVHEQLSSDPFHPSNLQWTVPPAAPESELQVRQRVKECIRFYALYFRDNIKRQKTSINFSGLPEIFIWYNGGIGLNSLQDLSSSWSRCFYDTKQSMQAHEILRRLIVDNEFDWPKAPNWVYRTHAVLEQMYHRVG